MHAKRRGKCDVNGALAMQVFWGIFELLICLVLSANRFVNYLQKNHYRLLKCSASNIVMQCSKLLLFCIIQDSHCCRLYFLLSSVCLYCMQIVLAYDRSLSSKQD